MATANVQNIVKQLNGKRASDINPSFKINCFTTTICYFENLIKDGKTTAQQMLDWLQKNTIQVQDIKDNTIVVVWSSSDITVSPDPIFISDLDRAKKGYPFGLVMEHTAIFLNEKEIFQKASPKDEDTFEIIPYNTMITNYYKRLAWVRYTMHDFVKR